MLVPIIERYREWIIDKFFRGDAGIAFPELYEFLQDEAFWYAIRLKSNQVLERHIGHILTRPEIEADGKSDVRYDDFEYQAAISANSPTRCASTPSSRAVCGISICRSSPRSPFLL